MYLVGRGFAIFDFVNFILDFIFVTRLWEVNYAEEDCILLLGMLISWGVTYVGKYRLHAGGLQYTPWFVNYDAYYQDMPNRRKLAPVIFTVALTEMAAFFFEDDASLSAFFALRDHRDDIDRLERLNLRLTNAKAALS
jgi:hypothetical protein